MFKKSFLVLVLLGFANTALADTYRINVSYTQPMVETKNPAGAQILNAPSEAPKQAEILEVETNTVLQNELEAYVDQHVFVSREEFKAQYGVYPEALRLATLIRRADNRIRFALPVGFKSNRTHLTNQNNTGEDVTQWNRQAWDMGTGTPTTYGIDAPSAWNLLQSVPLSSVNVVVIDDGIAPNAPYDFRSRLDYQASANIGADESNETVFLIMRYLIPRVNFMVRMLVVRFLPMDQM